MAASKIDEIHIQNFKFFPELTDPINLGGNHLLLYGENGSGKSSIYWALYTLLECSNKEDDDEIKKYFNPSNEERLVNINCPDTLESYIKIKLIDGTEFNVSHSDTSIKENLEAQESNYSSDFITYRNLLSLYNFAHSETINLIHFFSYAIFPYVKFNHINIKGKDITSSGKIFEYVSQGLQKIEDPSYNGKFRYPYPEEPEYKEYNRVKKHFQDELRSFLNSIVTEGNRILKDKLKYDFTFSVSLERDNKNNKKPKYAIRLTIPEYQGKQNVVYRPHSFLNEAKLTALGLAIRLAVFEKSLVPNSKLNVLILDDLLISLDMSNRDKVIDMVINEYQNDYQILFLTHDKLLFNLIKNRLEQYQFTHWCYYEMYVDTVNKMPIILLSESFYAKGCFHLSKFDYPASGNYFRKACEEIFEKYFPREVTIGNDGLQRKQLKNYIDSAVKFYERLGLNAGKIKQLDNFLLLLMNPLSHRAIETNIYNTELNDLKVLIPEIIEEIKKYELKELIAEKNTLIIRFTSIPPDIFEYTIQTEEPIYSYYDGTQILISNSLCKSKMSKTIKNNGQESSCKNEHFEENNIIDIHKAIYKFKNVSYDNSYMDNISKSVSGQTLNQLINS